MVWESSWKTAWLSVTTLVLAASKMPDKLTPWSEFRNVLIQNPWWRHQMETFSALLAICAGNSPVPGEFPAQRPVTRSFDVFFYLRTNKRLSKQPWGWWFETPSWSLWRQYNDNLQYFLSEANSEDCPVVWHFYRTHNKKNRLQKILERSLRILHDTYELSFEELLNRIGSSTTLLLHRLLLLEAYKLFSWHGHKLSIQCFNLNCTPHKRRSAKPVSHKHKHCHFVCFIFVSQKHVLRNEITISMIILNLILVVSVIAA